MGARGSTAAEPAALAKFTARSAFKENHLTQLHLEDFSATVSICILSGFFLLPIFAHEVPRVSLSVSAPSVPTPQLQRKVCLSVRPYLLLGWEMVLQSQAVPFR